MRASASIGRFDVDAPAIPQQRTFPKSSSICARLAVFERRAMHPAGRIILAALAAFILWTLVRAFRRGVIYSGGYGFALDDSPMLFTLAAIVHAFGALFFAYLAAGYEMAGFARLFGWS
jgi:hypothetical protein